MTKEQFAQKCWQIRLMAQYHFIQCVERKSKAKEKMKIYAIHLECAMHSLRAITELLYPDANLEAGSTEKFKELHDHGSPCTIKELFEYCTDLLVTLSKEHILSYQYIKINEIRTVIVQAEQFIDDYNRVENRAK